MSLGHILNVQQNIKDQKCIVLSIAVSHESVALLSNITVPDTVNRNTTVQE